MDGRLAELLSLLELERLEDDLFRGISRDIGAPQVYGGQVLGQALHAAYGTVEHARVVHSLHAYFLQRGDFDAPIVYFVDRSRDGSSFSNRRVTAIQHGAQIFHMAASFQLPQSGVEHQLAMPQVPPPESLADQMPLVSARLEQLPEKLRRPYRVEQPFEFRLIESENLAGSASSSAVRSPQAPAVMPAVRHLWIRAVDRLPDDETLHRCLLAYVSDFYLLYTATLPHEALFATGLPYLASIDHAMWFHRPVRVDSWFLYATDSPSASGARGFTRGSIFARDGRLLASTAQEGLVRMLERRP